MRALLAVTVAVVAALPWARAGAQVYVSSVTAAVPDPNGQVPGFNKVPGAGIENWANGVAQVVLVHGQSYNYCVSLGSDATANGTANVTLKILQPGGVTVQKATIVGAGGLSVGPSGIWYLCSGYKVLPDSPGPATLTGTVNYVPAGGGATVVAKLATTVVLQ